MTGRNWRCQRIRAIREETKIGHKKLERNSEERNTKHSGKTPSVYQLNGHMVGATTNNGQLD